MTRRVFLAAAAAGCAAAQELPESIRKLKPMLNGIQPITADERRARVEKARRLMRENKIQAVAFEPGTSLFYFTGVRGGQASWVLPASGEAAWFATGAPAGLSGDVRTYSAPDQRLHAIAQFLKERNANSRVGMEERTNFATVDGLSHELPAAEFVSADPVTVGCRVIKSPAEIALMQRANDITIEAYKAALQTLREGMTQNELSANINAAYRQTGRTGRCAWRVSANTPPTRTAASSRKSCARATWCS